MTDSVYVGIRNYAKGIDCESSLPEVSPSDIIESLESRVNFTDIVENCGKGLLKEEKYDIIELLEECKGGVEMKMEKKGPMA